MDKNEVLKYVEPILRFCKKRISNIYDAEDLASDIILQVMIGIEKYNIDSLDAWVWRVAHNRYTNFINSQSKNKMILSGDYYLFDITDNNSFEEKTENDENYRAIIKYLHTLSSEYKNIFVDYYLEKMSVHELSDKYSLSEATVKWRLNVSRTKIKKRIGECKMEQIYKRINWNTKTCNGCCEPDEYLHSQVSRAICLAAYEKPLTVEEISMATGIPTLYIEDELPRLEYGDAVKKTGNKFATDFIILRLEDKEKLEAVSKDCVKLVADAFSNHFSEKAEKLKSIDFYGNDFGTEQLGFIIIPYILRNKISEVKFALGLENGPFPLRKDGGYGWFVVEETEDENETVSDYYSGCNTAGDDSGSSYSQTSHIYYYWVNKYFDINIYHGRGIRWLCANGIPQNSENGIIKTNLCDEDAAQLIKNGLVSKCGGKYKLNFACFGQKEFYDYISEFNILNPEFEKAISEWIKKLRNTFSSIVPKRLDSQINQWVAYYANQLVGYVIEELIQRDVLERPLFDRPLTNGVFYVEGDYVNTI